MGNNEIAQTCSKYHSRIGVCSKAKGVSVVRNSEMLGMFVTLYSEDPARNISGKNVEEYKGPVMGKESKGRYEK